MPTSTRFLSFAPLVFLAVAAVVACSDGPTFLVGPAASDAGTTVDGGTTADTGAPDDAGPQDAAPPDAGPDPNDPKAVCAAVAGTIPAGATAVPEVYGPTMVGCPGKLAYSPNVVAGACGAGWTACSAEQVKARRGSQILAPRYHYWLAPRLWASPTGDTGRCYAAPATGTPTPSNCGNNTTGSMHFCSKVRLTVASVYNTPDELGNMCLHVNCDYDPMRFTSSTTVPNDAQPTNGDFGGCGNNETAGVLCCKN
jgi:hypothetical protein